VALLRARAQLPGAWVGVQEHRGSIVAIASGLQARSFDGSGDLIPALMHISMIAVEPALWGNGFGRSMTEFALATARGCAYEAAQLWTSRSNERARGLYEKLGFRATGQEKLDDRGEEIVHYRMEL
jgi:ribosomal protein S18 acetylase RimI-like enzyme